MSESVNLLEIGRAGAYFDCLSRNCERRRTRWRREMNSNSRYRCRNCQTTTSC